MKQMETFLGIMIPFLGTTLGAACVFFMKKSLGDLVQRALAGFAAGVMVAASIWSRHVGSNQAEGPKSRLGRTTMMVLAVTLHNIPEGMAVGVVYAGFLSGNTQITAASALALSLGIAIQNFPEGAAVSLPLRREGCSRLKSFFIGQASALVEPIAGVIGAATVVYIQAILPYALAFAAGAMILVAVHELIPECQQNQKADPYLATMGIVIGFTIMMLLDVALG